MEDKTRVVILSICYAVAFVVGAGLLVALRMDVGKEAFYTGLLILVTIVVVFAIQGVTAIGGRMAQRSDNVEIAMAGAYKAIMEYAAKTNQAQVEQVRVLRDLLPGQAEQMPSLPWMITDNNANSEPVFEAETVDWVGTNAPRH